MLGRLMWQCMLPEHGCLSLGCSLQVVFLSSLEQIHLLILKEHKLAS